MNGDGTINAANNPVPAGSLIQIYATGLGATTPPLPPGQPGAGAPDFNHTVLTPQVLIGGQPAEVSFSGAAPTFVGLYQLNVKVPAATPSGTAVPVQIQMGGRSSNPVTMAVR